MLTLVIPARDWPQERIDLCIEGFERLKSKLLTEILVIDFGSAVPIKLKSGVARVVRVESTVWSLAEAINVGVLSSSNDIIAKVDADILIAPASSRGFESTVVQLAAGIFGLAICQAVDLDSSVSAGAAAQLVAGNNLRLGRLRPKWGQGGLVLFSREVWDRVGGFDSRFTGWGNEDNDFAERVRRAGFRLRWADRDQISIFHVWHPPSYAATGVISQRERNQRIAKDDRSVFRSLAFRHSSFAELAKPAVLRTVAPLVTLGIATTSRPNRDRMIEEAISSFRGQIDNDFEVVIVDNGSPSPDTQRLRRNVRRLGWIDRVLVEPLSEPSIPRARNLISDIAKGRYICVVDDDDIALPNRLADHLRAFSSEGNVHGSHGGWIDFDESTGVIERNAGKTRTIATLLKGSGKITAHPASLYRTDVLRALRYDEAFELGSDFDLALRCANLGFDIRHTNSFLTLRRYHSSNVTITGQSNQVSNGLAARARALNTFSWSTHAALELEAKRDGDEAFCRNQLSIDSLAELIPGYTGVWQLYVPIDALMDRRLASVDQAQPVLSDAGLVDEEAFKGDEDGLRASYSHFALEPQGRTSTLEALLSLVDGDICCRRAGLNQPIYFRSSPIPEVSRARSLRERIEQLVGVPVQLNSVRQGQLDREIAFDWRSLEIKPGERVLQSERFDDLTELLARLNRIAATTLLRKMISVLSDFDEDGECYYIVTAPVRGHDEIRALKFDLENRMDVGFRHTAANGIPSELTVSRSH